MAVPARFKLVTLSRSLALSLGRTSFHVAMSLSNSIFRRERHSLPALQVTEGNAPLGSSRRQFAYSFGNARPPFGSEHVAEVIEFRGLAISGKLL